LWRGGEGEGFLEGLAEVEGEGQRFVGSKGGREGGLFWGGPGGVWSVWRFASSRGSQRFFGYWRDFFFGGVGFLGWVRSWCGGEGGDFWLL